MSNKFAPRRFIIAAVILLSALYFSGPTVSTALAKTGSQTAQSGKIAKKQVVKKAAKNPVKIKKAIKRNGTKKKGVGNGQCVAFAKWAAGLPGCRGNAIEWTKYINSNEPKEGAVAVFDYGRYGHVAVVTDVKEDAITVKEQNYYGPYIISSRKLDKTDPHILGYVTKESQVA